MPARSTTSAPTTRASRRLASVASLLALCVWTLPCRAQCRATGGVSPCIDANAVWLPTGLTRFVTIPSSLTLDPGRWGVGLGLQYFDNPVVLIASSPDPAGRHIRAVDDALDATPTFGIGVADRLELGAALPFRLVQHGAGAQAATTQNAAPITTSALRDPRVGASVPFFPGGLAPNGLWGGKATLELVLPLGNDQAFAGERDLVAAPSVTGDLALGRFFAATSLGARLRRTTTVGGARVGSQLTTSLGAGVDVLPRERLSVAAEAWALPTLVSQSRELPSGARVRDAALVPAEWMVSVRSSPLGDGDFTVTVGGGSAIPLSKETRVAPNGDATDERFAGVTAARFRLALVLRYAPLGRDANGDGRSDTEDGCPHEPEDRDGADDGDGCPDPDDDDDVLDADDLCPNQPEDRDGRDDADGCPEPDAAGQNTRS